MFIVFCLSIALVVMYADALLCVAIERKFNWKTSLVFALLWPVSLPLAIISAVKHTKGYSE